MHYWNYTFGPCMGMMYFGMILFLLFLFALVVLLMRKHSPFPGTPPSETPLGILKQRYARGEITREQFEQMRRDIGE